LAPAIEEALALDGDLGPEVVDAALADPAVLDGHRVGRALQAVDPLLVLLLAGQRPQIDLGEQELAQVVAAAEEVAVEVDRLALEDPLGLVEVGDRGVEAEAELVEDGDPDPLLARVGAVDLVLLA